MSLQSSQAETSRPYRILLEVYRAARRSDSAAAREQLSRLPLDLRNRIFGEIYELAKRPQDVEWNWGEVHVFDSLPRLLGAVELVTWEVFKRLCQDVKEMVLSRMDFWERHSSYSPSNGELMLKGLDDIRTDISFAETQKILDAWVDEATSPEELQIAREAIIRFVYSRWYSDELSFKFRKLFSLPQFVPLVGFTTRLTSLDLSGNPLQSLPAEIGQLQALEKLIVYRCHLQSLPPEIGRLQSLTELSAFGNNLQSLPPEIGQLQALKDLFLSWNDGFQSLPSEIGRLQELRKLALNHNPRLTGIPLQILDLPSTCTLDLERTGLSQAVLGRLREAISSRDYHGPRIRYSMENAEARTVERPMAALLEELFRLAGQPGKQFPNLMNAARRERESLHSWLSRLSYTADYKKGGEKQEAFARKVLGYMQLAEENPQYRSAFFITIEDASETCGDRVALSILKLGIALRLTTMDKGNLDALAAFLINTVWPVDMLENIARNRIPALPFLDEIEVYLAYPVKLQETLGLEIDVEDMLYFGCSGVKQQDLDEAANFVRIKQSDRNAALDFLIKNEHWVQALKVKYPEEMEAIEQEVEQAMDAGRDYGAIQARRKEQLKALSERHVH